MSVHASAEILDGGTPGLFCEPCDKESMRDSAIHENSILKFAMMHLICFVCVHVLAVSQSLLRYVLTSDRDSLCASSHGPLSHCLINNQSNAYMCSVRPQTSTGKYNHEQEEHVCVPGHECMYVLMNVHACVCVSVHTVCRIVSSNIHSMYILHQTFTVCTYCNKDSQYVHIVSLKHSEA
jgi:hypothetical protein